MQPSLFEKRNIKKKYEEVFEAAYKKLNTEQNLAVDHIEGPVMVIAGPGTGKTQILAVRIGKILKDTDTQAHNILCLTYTDAATISMRNRLVEIIGPDAHRVHIYTFHGFCNQVIQENLGYFGDYRQLEPITDLERVDVYKKIMDELPPDHPLKKLKGDVNNITSNRLRNLFSLMKKENYDAAYVDNAIDTRIKELPEDEAFIYKRKYKQFNAGDLKQKDYDKEVGRLEELRAGAHLFEHFLSIMKDIGRYDYDDMILWVMRAFESSEDLLLQYQERYQYFLVDEFQDTNGSQKRLLDLLISFWSDAPNVFVVGDDDQAIYKFQGANMGNITDFKKDYDPSRVVLVQNYRSSQRILNAAMAMIDFNQERIVKDESFDLDKTLIAKSAHKDLDREVAINSYANLVHEQAAIAAKLESEYRAGRDLSEIAIIYRNHRQVEKLVEVLEKKGVPLNIKRRVDILKMPLVRNVLNILTFINEQYLNKGYTDKMLFEMMHYNFFSIRSQDVATLIWETRNREYDQEGQDTGRTPLGELIGDNERLKSLKLSSTREISHLNDLLDKWVADVNDVTLQVLFQNVINEGHILNYVLQHPDKSWLLQVLGTLFDLIKEESTKKPDLSISEFLEMIQKMNENKLPLAINKIMSSEKGAQFITAHSSKGLEYNEVIVIGATKDVWDKRRGGNNYFKYPPLMNGDNDVNVEDERRLMFVAMTRAEKALDISYSLSKENGKALGASQFVDELRSATDLQVSQQQVPSDTIDDFQYNVLFKQEKKVELIDHDLIDRMLQGYKLSVTGLNKYLKCPVTFYFEAVLRVPMARTKYLGYGRAIHYALEYYHRDLNEGKEPTQESLLKYYRVGMKHHRAHFTSKEYKDMIALGEQILPKYFDKYLAVAEVDVKEYGLEIKIDNAEYEGVPIKGVLDRVAVKKDEVIVTDYKTGNALGAHTKPKLSTPSDRKPEGGDYWRQIVFYKILLDSDRKYNWNMITGIMDFVEPDKKTGEFTQKSYAVSPAHVKKVGEQITQTWADIKAHKFDKGCGEDDCQWCNFVQNDYVMDVTLIDEDDESFGES